MNFIQKQKAKSILVHSSIEERIHITFYTSYVDNSVLIMKQDAYLRDICKLLTPKRPSP